ncbi:MAG: helix-turn-helix domain-containing protein [Actinomycetota bacterium]|nr:helix-turn-helix domain-containing protein [Actinomycetota bacterium]
MTLVLEDLRQPVLPVLVSKAHQLVEGEEGIEQQVQGILCRYNFVMDQRKYPEINGSRLRELRVSKALTLRQLGEASGVAFDRINKLELRSGAVRPSTIHKLAGALGVDPSELIGQEAAR